MGYLSLTPQYAGVQLPTPAPLAPLVDYFSQAGRAGATGPGKSSADDIDVDKMLPGQALDYLVQNRQLDYQWNAFRRNMVMEAYNNGKGWEYFATGEGYNNYKKAQLAYLTQKDALKAMKPQLQKNFADYNKLMDQMSEGGMTPFTRTFDFEGNVTGSLAQHMFEQQNVGIGGFQGGGYQDPYKQYSLPAFDEFEDLYNKSFSGIPDSRLTGEKTDWLASDSITGAGGNVYDRVLTRTVKYGLGRENAQNQPNVDAAMANFEQAITSDPAMRRVYNIYMNDFINTYNNRKEKFKDANGKELKAKDAWAQYFTSIRSGKHLKRIYEIAQTPNNVGTTKPDELDAVGPIYLAKSGVLPYTNNPSPMIRYSGNLFSQQGNYTGDWDFSNLKMWRLPNTALRDNNISLSNAFHDPTRGPITLTEERFKPLAFDPATGLPQDLSGIMSKFGDQIYLVNLGAVLKEYRMPYPAMQKDGDNTKKVYDYPTVEAASQYITPEGLGDPKKEQKAFQAWLVKNKDKKVETIQARFAVHEDIIDDVIKQLRTRGEDNEVDFDMIDKDKLTVFTRESDSEEFYEIVLDIPYETDFLDNYVSWRQESKLIQEEAKEKGDETNLKFDFFDDRALVK